MQLCVRGTDDEVQSRSCRCDPAVTLNGHAAVRASGGRPYLQVAAPGRRVLRPGRRVLRPGRRSTLHVSCAQCRRGWLLAVAIILLFGQQLLQPGIAELSMEAEHAGGQHPLWISALSPELRVKHADRWPFTTVHASLRAVSLWLAGQHSPRVSHPRANPRISSENHVVQPLIPLLEPTGARCGVFHSHYRHTFVGPFAICSAHQLDSARRRRVSFFLLPLHRLGQRCSLRVCTPILECAVPFSPLCVFEAF
jgi:hypothetical protein